MKTSLLTLLLFILLCNTSLAQSSFLDPSFGAGGIVITYTATTNSNGAFNSVIMQPDNKILAAGFAEGQGIVVRYNENGSIDSSFAVNGIFTNTAIGPGVLSLQPDGKILDAGGVIIFRLNSDGSLDNTFGIGGIANLELGSSSIALQPDGKIIVGGISGSMIGVCRVLSDGVPDTSFGINGLTTFPGLVANGVAVMPDGRIVAGGLAYGYSFIAVRFLSNGTLDTSFNHIGSVITSIGYGGNYCYAMQVQPDGKVVLGGTAAFGINGNDFTLIRYCTDGSIDRSYGDTGVVNIDFNGNDDEIRAMYLMPDGETIVGGDAIITTNQDFALARINSNGIVDSAFGVNGRIATPILGYGDFGETLTVQSNGRIILAGNATIGNYPDNYSKCALARYIVTPPVGVKQVGCTDTYPILYPNPATTKLNINSNYIPHITHITAFDVTGKVINFDVLLAQKEIEVNEMSKGIYYFNIAFDDRAQITQKILIQNNK